MRIIIAGGTGFIGQALVDYFFKKNHELIIIGRDKEKIKNLYQGKNRVYALSWDEFFEQKKDTILTSDLIINLAGANIAQKRWTKKRKHEIIASRVQTTKALAETCALFGSNSPPLFNASAVGIYGLQKPIAGHPLIPFKESDPIDFEVATDFVSEITHAWEKATHIARDHHVRVVNMRFALVLDKKGLLAKLYPSYILGLGGPIGSGNQPFAFIALSDLVEAIEFLINKPEIKGPVNMVAPQSISQSEFAHTYAKVLHRPSFLWTPGFLLKLIFGKMAEELLINGQYAYPEVLLSNGFIFNYPTIESTLQHIYRQ